MDGGESRQAVRPGRNCEAADLGSQTCQYLVGMFGTCAGLFGYIGINRQPAHGGGLVYLSLEVALFGHVVGY